MVPHLLLHDPVPCAGCRARVCPVEGHPCIDALPVETVVEAVERLAGTRRPVTSREAIRA